MMATRPSQDGRLRIKSIAVKRCYDEAGQWTVLETGRN